MTALLTLLLLPTAAHPASAVGVEGPPRFADWARRAQLAEQAGLDAVFVADAPAAAGGSTISGGFEPLTLLAALARETSTIGLIGTSSTSFGEPYNVARQYASLQLVSDGRAGWNSVTTSAPGAAANFGDEHWRDHARRYRIGHEFTGIVRDLWRSGEQPIEHEGEFFRVRGPLDVALPGGRRPLITQAGGSDHGLRLAAAFADATFANLPSLEATLIARAALREAERAAHRAPGRHVRLLPGVVPYLAATEGEALAYKRRLDESVDVRPLVAPTAHYLHLDQAALAALPLDGEFPTGLLVDPSEVDNSVATYTALREVVLTTRPTVRQLLLKAGGAARHREFVGTPGSFADEIERWLAADAVDGFTLMPPSYERDLPYLAEHAAPVLRDRGLLPAADAPRDLHDRFGVV